MIFRAIYFAPVAILVNRFAPKYPMIKILITSPAILNIIGIKPICGVRIALKED